jgi:Cu(I)/Ag(I) efflux system membrane fusion protein
LVNAQEEYLLALSRNNKSLMVAARNRLEALQLSNNFINQLEQQRKVQQNITFNAPQDGVVDNLNIREGFFVKPGTTLMSIGQLDQVWVEAEVFERQASLVKEGLPVMMTLDYLQGKEWSGEVDYVYPTLDPKTRTLRVRLRFQNKDRVLKPNMFAEVKIFADSKERLLLVPKESVIRTGSKNVVVLALGEGRFKSVAIQLGASDEEYTAITKGLNANDKVVVSAQFLLDSESSKNSDFKRMHHESEEKKVSDIPVDAWVSAKVESIDKTLRKARIKHAAIPVWNWPIMTMKFSFSDDVDLSALAEGVEMHMQLTKQSDGSALITAIHVMDKTERSAGDSDESMKNMSQDAHKNH